MLRQHQGALLVVSHDRAFLRNLGTGIIWLHGGKLRRREGHFDEFESWSDGILADEAVALGWKQHLIAGGVARGVAVGSLFPVDSIKTKMQIGQKVCCAAPTRVRRVCCTPAGARNPSDTAWTLQQFCFA